MLSRSDPEEVDLMADDTQTALTLDVEEAAADAAVAVPSNIPFMRQLDATAQSKRDVFFALYFSLSQGRNQVPSKNPNATHEVTFGELWDAAGVISYNLRKTWNISKGERVMLCYSYGPSGIAALLGCWRAGVVALIVPAPPISQYDTISVVTQDVATAKEAALAQLAERAQECQPIAMVLTDYRIFRKRNIDLAKPWSSTRASWLPKIPWRATESLQQNPALHFLKGGPAKELRDDGPPERQQKRPFYTYDETNCSFQDLALIQYTSGSTGDKAYPVMINFASLQACLDMTQRFFDKALLQTGESPAKVSALTSVTFTTPGTCWGLVHTTLLPMMNGWCMYYMSPQEFSKNPLLWLQRISQHKITWALAPDIDFPRIVEAFLRAEQAASGVCPIAHFDLSNVRHWHAIGQPLRAETYHLVTNTLQKYGLQKTWYTASYGLTEHVAGTMFLPFEFQTCCGSSDDDFDDKIKGAILPKQRVAVANKATLDPTLQVKIVDPQSCQEVVDGQIGELWLSSPVVAAGYCGNYQLTTKRFGVKLQPSSEQERETSNNERYLRTEDAAFFQDGYLYVCGALSDILTIDKKSYFPQDIEWVAEEASIDVIPGCVAALTLPDSNDLIIVFEIANNHYEEPNDVCNLINKAVLQRIGLSPSQVVAIRQGDISTTANGKIQRRIIRHRLQMDKLDILVDFVDLNHLTPIDKGTDEYVQRIKKFDGVLAKYFGSDFKNTQSWEDLGLDSLSAIDLRYDIASSFHVHLSNRCFKIHPTPAAMKDVIPLAAGPAIPIELPHIPQVSSIKLSWLIMGVLQAVLAVVLLLLFSTSAISVWYVFDYLVEFNLILAIIPIIMGIFSVVVVLTKWIVIGRYTAAKLTSPSVAYLRWWFVDRLVGVWEIWVGQFFLSTPIINLFYILMGANISLSAQLGGFCREFDLVTVGSYSRLHHRSLRPRRFSPWDHSQSGPTMAFRPITIGNHSEIRGMLSPGVTVGENVVVEKLSVVPEGSQVEDRVNISGNPGVVTGRPRKQQTSLWWLVGIFKIKWLIIEFFIFNVIVLTCEWGLKVILPVDYYYMWLIWWTLFVVLFAAMSLASSIVVKWILLGRRKTGKYHHKVLLESAEWAADYHFFLSTIIFTTFSPHSRFCNIILKLHGMDIDLVSKVYLNSFPPSKMDFIHLSESFVAGASFDVKKYGAYYNSIITNSSIGELAHVGAGLMVQNAVIAPATLVSSRTELPRNAKGDHRLPKFSMWNEIILSSVYVLILLAFKLSIYAGYCYWKFFINFPYPPGWASIFVLAGAIFIQSTLWMLLIFVLQAFTYIGMTDKHPVPWSNLLYFAYLSSIESFQTWSAVSILWGCQLFNDIARILGASIEGRALYFGARMYDGPWVNVSNRTVSDGGILCGHSIVYEVVTCGPVRVAGLVHEGTLVIANASITTKESGPWRPIMPKTQDVAQHYTVDASQDLEAPETRVV